MRAFANNVRWLRARAGLSQTELAARLRCCVSYVSYLESGQREPRLKTIRALARAFHVKPWYLLADLTENLDFWDGYLRLPAPGKREIQRQIKCLLEGRE